MYSVEIKNNKEIYDFCMVNGITDINKFIQDCFKQGFDIKKYGLLGKTGGEQEKWVEKEVIVEKLVEIPVEVIKEVEKIVEIEKVVEVIKEVPVEKIVEITKEVPVEKIVTIYDKSDDSELMLKIHDLEQEFSTKKEEMENIFQNEMSKKEKELEELRRNLDINLDENKVKMLETTLQNIRKELSLKNTKINELEGKIKQLEGVQNVGAIYLKGSNLTQNL